MVEVIFLEVMVKIFAMEIIVVAVAKVEFRVEFDLSVNLNFLAGYVVYLL